MLVEEGLLEENDLSEYMTSELTIDYGLLYSWRFKILKKLMNALMKMMKILKHLIKTNHIG